MGAGQAIGRSKLARHSLHGHGQAWRSSLECPLGRDLPSRRFLRAPGEHQEHNYGGRGPFLARVRVLVHAPALPPLRRLRSSEDRRFSITAAPVYTAREGPGGPSVEESCQGWLRVSIALVLSRVNDTGPRYRPGRRVASSPASLPGRWRESSPPSPQRQCSCGAAQRVSPATSKGSPATTPAEK